MAVAVLCCFGKVQTLDYLRSSWVQLRGNHQVVSSLALGCVLLIVPFLLSTHILSTGFVVAERLSYPSTAGMAFLVASGLLFFGRLLQSSTVQVVFGVLVFQVFVVGTMYQSHIFRSSFSLYQHAAGLHRPNCRMNLALAQVL